MSVLALYDYNKESKNIYFEKTKQTRPNIQKTEINISNKHVYGKKLFAKANIYNLYKTFNQFLQNNLPYLWLDWFRFSIKYQTNYWSFLDVQ